MKVGTYNNKELWRMVIDGNIPSYSEYNRQNIAALPSNLVTVVSFDAVVQNSGGTFVKPYYKNSNEYFMLDIGQDKYLKLTALPASYYQNRPIHAVIYYLIE